jgi:hypothetical protein
MRVDGPLRRHEHTSMGKQVQEMPASDTSIKLSSNYSGGRAFCLFSCLLDPRMRRRYQCRDWQQLVSCNSSSVAVVRAWYAVPAIRGTNNCEHASTH